MNYICKIYIMLIANLKKYNLKSFYVINMQEGSNKNQLDNVNSRLGFYLVLNYYERFIICCSSMYILHNLFYVLYLYVWMCKQCCPNSKSQSTLKTDQWSAWKCHVWRHRNTSKRRIATRPSWKGNQPLNIKTAVERPSLKLGLPNSRWSLYYS